MVKLKCVVKITKILKKSYASMFSDIKEGDKILFSIELARAGVHYNRTRPAKVTCCNLASGQEVVKTLNELDTILKSFEYEGVL